MFLRSPGVARHQPGPAVRLHRRADNHRQDGRSVSRRYPGLRECLGPSPLAPAGHLRQREEPVNIDFVSRFGGPIPCLAAKQDDNDYQTILAVVPGDVLMDVYGEYGSRLLQLNVRSFLKPAAR